MLYYIKQHICKLVVAGDSEATSEGQSSRLVVAGDSEATSEGQGSWLAVAGDSEAPPVVPRRWLVVAGVSEATYEGRRNLSNQSQFSNTSYVMVETEVGEVKRLIFPRIFGFRPAIDMIPTNI